MNLYPDLLCSVKSDFYVFEQKPTHLCPESQADGEQTKATCSKALLYLCAVMGTLTEAETEQPEKLTNYIMT